jgi:hypothetical protein
MTENTSKAVHYADMVNCGRSVQESAARAEGLGFMGGIAFCGLALISGEWTIALGGLAAAGGIWLMGFIKDRSRKIEDKYRAKLDAIVK